MQFGESPPQSVVKRIRALVWLVCYIHITSGLIPRRLICCYVVKFFKIARLSFLRSLF